MNSYSNPLTSLCFSPILWFATIFSMNLTGQDIKNISGAEYSNYQSILDHLSLSTSSNEQKVEEIYEWIITHISYNYKSVNDSSYSFLDSPQDIVSRGSAICSEYVILFSDLLSHIDIVSYPVSGYCKNCSSENELDQEPTHVWTAVKLNDEWLMCDVTWDAELSRLIGKKKKSRRYFMKNSIEFLFDHLPAMPMWQMNDSIVSIKEFKTQTSPIHIQYFRDWRIEFKEYRSKSKLNQKVYEARMTYEFNPTTSNKNEYGHLILDKASLLNNTLVKSRNHNDYLEEKRIRNSVIMLCQKAEELNITFHTWQKEMFAEVMINSIVAEYENESNLDWCDEDWLGLLDKLPLVDTILIGLKNTYYKEFLLELRAHIEDAINEQLD